MPRLPQHLRRRTVAPCVAIVASLLAPAALVAQDAPGERDAQRFRLTIALGPSTSFRSATPHTVEGPGAYRLAGSGGNGRHLALGLARPVGRALVFRVEGSYNRLTSPPNSWVMVDSSGAARAALVDETATVGLALQVRLREDRARWAPYLVAGGGIAGNRLGTNPDEGSARVTARTHHLRGTVSYGAGMDLPVHIGGRMRGAFAEVRLQRMIGDRHGSDFVPMALGVRF